MASEPFYEKYKFILSLPAKSWNAVTDNPCDDKISVSQLLHEYTHYLQEVATSYGHISRNCAYRGNPQKESDVIAGIGLSIISIKENMAANSQRYQHDDSCQAIPHESLYTIATDFADDIIKGINGHPLYLYAIEYITLFTNNPVGSFAQILNSLSNVNNIHTIINTKDDEQYVHMVIDEAYKAIVQTNHFLDVDIPVEDMQVSNQPELIEYAYRNIELEDNKFFGEHPALRHISEYVHGSCIKALKMSLQDKYKLIDTLISFKHSMDFNIWYNLFGTPFMTSEDTQGIVRTNVDRLIALSKYV